MTEKSMYNYLFQNIDIFKDRTALIFLNKKISFGRLAGEVDRVAEGLRSLGGDSNNSVTICLPNSPNAVVAFYAANRLGAAVNIVHPFTPAVQLAEFMKKADSKFVFLNDFAYFRYKEEIEKTDIKTIICRLETYMPSLTGAFFSLGNRKKSRAVNYRSEKIIKYGDLLHFPPCKEVPDDSFQKPSVYLHSGGTTGEPKTVMLDNRAFNALSSHAFDIIDIKSFEETKGKVMLSVLPMFHAFGLGVCVHMALCNGIASLLIPKFTGNTAIRAIKKHKADIWVGVPTMFGRIVNNKCFEGKYLSRVTDIFTGADSMPQNLRQKFAEALKRNGSRAKVCEGYGLTETASIAAVNTNKTYREGSAGRPLKGIEVRAYDNEKNEFCPAGECGELVIKGNQTMHGYLGDSEATAAVKKTHEGGEWIHTGDYGYVDADGFVFFRQRIKRIVKISGVAVFPSEIEEAVTSLPFVKHACAIGVAREKSGAAIKLFVELANGTPESEETKEQILAECRKRVIKWAVPREITFSKELPLTPFGKVDFKKLEDK